MNSQEICVWLDSRWYQALSRQLKDETIEDKLNEYLDELLNQLPAPVYEKISREIWEEDQRLRQEQEAAKVFSAFHIIEHGQDEYFQFDREVSLPTVARHLRQYLRREPGMRGESFSERFQAREPITAERFDELVSLRLENTGKVAGAYELDFDRLEFSGLNIMDGWKTYSMEDVSAAAYHAFRKENLPAERRLEILLHRLDGKEITWADRPAEGLTMGPSM